LSLASPWNMLHLTPNSLICGTSKNLKAKEEQHAWALPECGA